MRRQRVIRALLSLLIISSISCSASDGKAEPSNNITSAPPARQPRWLTKEEGEKLNKGGEKKDVDALDAFVLMTLGDDNREQKLQGTIVAIKMALHDLFYDVDLSARKHPADDPAFYRTLVEFKERIGSPQAGIFTAADMSSLFYYQQLSKYVDHNVSPLGLFSVSQTGGYTRAIGTWEIKGEKLASPINLARIDCWQADGTCTITDAELKPPSKEGGAAYLTSDTTHWDIKSWQLKRLVREWAGIARP